MLVRHCGVSTAKVMVCCADLGNGDVGSNLVWPINEHGFGFGVFLNWGHMLLFLIVMMWGGSPRSVEFLYVIIT